MVEQFEEYLAELRQRGRCEKYLNGLRTQIATLVKACGWVTIKDIKADSFCVWRRRQTKTAKTLNEYFIAASAFLNWLERCERIPRNPLKVVERMESCEDSKSPRRALTAEEARRLVAVEGPWKAVYLTALKTGLRRGDLYGRGAASHP